MSRTIGRVTPGDTPAERLRWLQWHHAEQQAVAVDLIGEQTTMTGISLLHVEVERHIKLEHHYRYLEVGND